MRVRDATEADAAACAAIYAPYVRDTVITFELEPPSPGEMAERIASAQRGHAWLVAEEDGEVVGYAYAGAYKTRPAYRWSCEVSVYLDRRAQGRGIGRALYAELFPRLRDRGFRMLVAGITVPNPASERLHRSLGFAPGGVMRRIGWKSGAWHDVAISQLALGGPEDPPAEPR